MTPLESASIEDEALANENQEIVDALHFFQPGPGIPSLLIVGWVDFMDVELIGHVSLLSFEEKEEKVAQRAAALSHAASR